MTRGPGTAEVAGERRSTASSSEPDAVEVSSADDLAPSLDRTSAVWVGTFPGFGMVRVHPDGEVEVVAAERPGDDPDTAELRERALRSGWGEPLSFARRGFHLAHGAAVGPLDGETCMLVLGDQHDTAIVLLNLVRLGWAVLGDRPIPLEWDGLVLTAHPRSAPVVVSERRAIKASISGTKVRGDTNAVALELPRITEPRRVSAVVSMQMRKPDENALTTLAGHEKFETAAGLFMRGTLRPASSQGADDAASSEQGNGGAANLDESPAKVIADHLALTRLPMARLRFDSATRDDDVAALLTWWLTLARSP